MRKSIVAADAACNTIVQLVDQGSVYLTGGLNLRDIDSTLITRLPLSLPAFRDATDGTSVANLIYDATATRDATAALYDISNRDDAIIWDGTASTFSGIGDFKLISVILYEDSTVVVTSGFYAVPR